MADRERSDIEFFIRSLPDPQAARIFLERLTAQHPVHAEKGKRNPLLLSRLLTVATHSPFLAENLLRHPDDIDWFARETERNIGSVKTTEQLSEDLSRLVTRMFDADARTQLTRFKNRELLRIYLRDCLHIAMLAEVTEELSNLADVILQHALKLAQQEVTNKHGAPQSKAERGRLSAAEFAIVSLGKLGCCELNYASDIDLMFLYAGIGETAGDGRSPASVIGNKEYFTRVAQRVVQLISGGVVEAGVYRVDLRLRPYGRDGDLVWEVAGAAAYYHQKAQNWERQMLIRSRASAGSEAVFASFFDAVRDIIFHSESGAEAIADVRRAKEKIDRKVALQALQVGGGFNVKLGAGGIREIEFIAQALQLAHGGREPWVRSGVGSAQTLIVLARLAEKGYLSEQERATLSAAYTFFRIVEHRLQMEHGAQTHTLPIAENRLDLLARRCGYQTARASASVSPASTAADLLRDVEWHSERVRRIYHRVFGKDVAAPVESVNPRPAPTGGLTPNTAKDRLPLDSPPLRPVADSPIDDESGRLIHHAATAISRLLATDPREGGERHTSDPSAVIETRIASSLHAAINPIRSLKNLISWADSFSTYGREESRAIVQKMSDDLPTYLTRLLAVFSSQHLSSILISRPLLASSLVASAAQRTTDDFSRALRAATHQVAGSSEKADALRRAWYQLVVNIGYNDLTGGRWPVVNGQWPVTSEYADRANQECDLAGPKQSADERQPATDHRPPTTDHLRRSNGEQTALAEASLQLAAEITLESLGVRDPLPFVIIGLGRLGHAGMDYGSDLDLLVVFDDEVEWAAVQERVEATQAYSTAQEFYARFTADLLRVLSSITREGFIYRVDLRLRPEGKNGQLAQGLQSLRAYLGERASAWEHSAYLKVREIAGDLSLGKRARREVCETIFAAASQNPTLQDDLRAMRLRLEREKAKGNRRDIKWGAGGMTDVYFITRYVQLRDQVTYPTEKGTLALIQHLGESGSLEVTAARQLFDGYLFLRRLDHWMRLLLDRPTSVLPASQIALADLAQALELGSSEIFERDFARHTGAIREVFLRVFP